MGHHEVDRNVALYSRLIILNIMILWNLANSFLAYKQRWQWIDLHLSLYTKKPLFLLRKFQTSGPIVNFSSSIMKITTFSHIYFYTALGNKVNTKGSKRLETPKALKNTIRRVKFLFDSLKSFSSNFFGVNFSSEIKFVKS